MQEYDNKRTKSPLVIVPLPLILAQTQPPRHRLTSDFITYTVMSCNSQRISPRGIPQ